MKTIQQYFREANVDELVNDYLFEHPITIRPCDDFDPTRTIAEVYEGYKAKVRGLIEDIQTIKIKSQDDDDIMVFFVHHCTENEYGKDVCVMLAKLSDLLDENKMTVSYGYEFVPLAESAGYLVADTYLTQRNISMVLIDFMHEASFFGFKQEDLANVVAELESRLDVMQDIQDEPAKYESFEEFGAFIGWEPEKRDSREKEAWSKLISAEIEYSKTATEIEEAKVREMYYDAQSQVME